MEAPAIVRGPWNAFVGFLKIVAPLLVRLVYGWSFLQAGFGKFQHFQQTAAFFEGLGVIPLPSANAALVATVELVGGACLMIGLATRVSALLLSATMVVAILTAEHDAFVGAFSGGDQALTEVVPFVFLLFMLMLAAFGPGDISVDRFLRRKDEFRR